MGKKMGPVRRTKREVLYSTRKIRLDDNRRYLSVERVTTKSEVVYEYNHATKSRSMIEKRILSDKVDYLTFPLQVVSKQQLATIRRDRIPSFVFKEDDNLYWTEIPSDLSLVSLTFMRPHQCAVNGYECRRLSAASDEDGGCAKVRNKATRIEAYPWIKSGYETFGITNHSFVVFECEHYEKVSYDRDNYAEE